jgi:molybdopterin-guanine dinucleotide biosynthesis protein A
MTGAGIFPPDRTMSRALPAGGTSIRMGTSKAALPFGGMPLIEAHLWAVRPLDPSPCCVVNVNAREELAPAARLAGRLA